jgi:FG-GAP repeat/Thrombospondin type 3 repeat
MIFKRFIVVLGAALAMLVAGAMLAPAAQAAEQKLTASDGGAGDSFGISVAIDGDTMVVGADTDDVGTNGDQGSAYVFVRSGGVWVQQLKLTAGDGASSDHFGVSVAISGDTLIVGAYLDDVGTNQNQGSAYVFVRSDGVWVQQQKLTASDGASGDGFGGSVALDGDTLVVGTYGDDIGTNGNQGSAYVFVRSGGVWSQQQKLTAIDGSMGDQFGFSVALSGDTLVAGAYFDEVSGNVDQGSTYMFVRSGGVWSQQQKLTASDGSQGDQFGFSVALGGDTLVVGANRDDDGASPDQGSAYVFVRSDGVWSQQQKLTASDRSGGDQFGVSVALDGDTLAVGAEIDTVSVNLNKGSAYVVVRNGGVWSERQKLTASDGAAFDKFGVSVAIGPDLLVSGAAGDDVGTNPNQGSAYAFALDSDADGDGVPDAEDNCPNDANPHQENNDGDASGDACDPDDDNDGVPDEVDAFPTDPDESADTDNDGVGDNGDNCPAVANSDQSDVDGDGVGDACDPVDNRDADGDGVSDGSDNCPTVANSDQRDTDRDGVGDACDPTPGSTPGCAGGLGTLATNPKAGFAFGVRYRAGASAPEGLLGFTDRAAGKTLTSGRITSVIIVGSHATIRGEGRTNGGQTVAFKVEVDDLSSNGRLDIFRIEWPGYSAAGTLRSGNITLACPRPNDDDH